MELTLKDRHINIIKKRLINKVKPNIKSISDVEDIFIHYRFCNETLIFMFVTLSNTFNSENINLTYDYKEQKFTEIYSYDYKKFVDFLLKYPDVNNVINDIKLKFDEIKITDIW